MNNSIVINEIPLKVDIDEFFEQIHVKKDAKKAERIYRLIEEVQENTRPVAIFRRAEYQEINAGVFTLDGVSFNSETINKILREKDYIFPNIVSCGKEIETICLNKTSLFDQYITVELCNYSCKFAQTAMMDIIDKEIPKGEEIDLFPGERGWDIQQGIQVFKIFTEEAKENNISISPMGVPFPSRTAFGLLTR